MTKRIKWDIDKVREFVEQNSECKLLSEYYFNMSGDLRFLCKCKEEFQTSFSNFKRKDIRMCKACCGLKDNKNRNKWSDKKIKYMVEKKTKSGCKFIKRKENSKSKIILRCGCGGIFETTINTFINSKKHYCKECGINRIKESFKIEYNEVKSHLENISSAKLLSETYENTYTDLLFECECGNTFETCRSTFINSNKRRCDVCSNITSQGELKIMKYLEQNNIVFKREYSFKDLLSDLGYNLRFDFAIIINNKLSSLIEYDGKFHFEDIYKNGGLKKQQYHDQLKNDYCKQNNIPLLRIPYWEFDNIENILNKEI